nr:hypothetical protein [Streptomyces sp. Ag109_O5-1]
MPTSPASAPSTTCDWSRAATSTPPTRSSKVSPRRCNSTTAPSPTCTASPTPRPRPGDAVPAPRRAQADLQPLLDGWPLTPAYAQGTAGHVVAANRPAVALCPFFAVGSNPLRAVFLEPEMRSLYPQWDDMTAKAVSGLRATHSINDADPGLLESIGEMTVTSERFRTLWARREVRRGTAAYTRFNHPLVGQLDLRYEKLLRPEAQQLLVVYHADQGSSSAERLQLLTSL